MEKYFSEQGVQEPAERRVQNRPKHGNSGHGLIWATSEKSTLAYHFENLLDSASPYAEVSLVHASLKRIPGNSKNERRAS